jgi:GT2 family glycosyltransferase
MPRAALPLVIVPVFNAVPALDACLAALDRTLPAGSAVRIVDDASTDPQVEPLARGWCGRSALDATYRRQPARGGELRAVESVLADPGTRADADIVVLGADAVPTASWLEAIAACAARAVDVASLLPWSNRDELAAFPNLREPNPLPLAADADAIALAAAALRDVPVADLPPATGTCLYLRRSALRAVGGLDGGSFRGPAGFDDFCRRASALGWRHGLCASAHVGRQEAALAPDLAASEDRGRLHARWPDQQERIVRGFLDDPLRELRSQLQARLEQVSAAGPQRDLFA